MSTQPTCDTEYYHVGAVIDEHYRLTEFIGAGGMACVYKAQEEGSPHQYAIKFLKAEYHNLPYLIEYFRDEASSMRDLAHPNIVRFYRFVNAEQYSYIIMDYVDGFALSDVIKRVYKQKRDIPLDEAVRILTQVARALDAIHREGYVHRDVKPSNVLIERRTGQTFLTDLGITTATNTRVEGAGTLAYMPPEQIETWVADHRSDIYSFGILAFELLAKQRPFLAEKGLQGLQVEVDMLRKHKETPVPDITGYRRGLPQDLNAIMQKLLAKTPDERYDTIMEAARDIHAVLQPLLSADMQDFTTITHRRIAAPEASSSKPGNQRLFAAMLGVGVVAIVVAGLIAASAFFSPGSATPAVTASPTPTRSPTSTPNPLVGQPVFDLVTGFAALAEPISAEDLIVTPAEDGPLQFLRVGHIEGFTVTMNIADSAEVTRYGLAFRLQDAANYLLFTLNPNNGNWAFSEVVDGAQTTQRRGTLDSIPAALTISGYRDFFQVDVGFDTLETVSTLFPAGSLALYIEDGTLTLESLSLGLVGPEAAAAVGQTPTPAPGIADPLRFLRADVAALIATNNVLRSEIDCPTYITLYDTLERHLSSSHASVRNLAQDTIVAGEVVYALCRSDSPNEPLNFLLLAFQDYQDWEEAMSAIQADLRN